MAFLYFTLFLVLLFLLIGAVIYFFTNFASRIKYFFLATLFLGWVAIFLYSYVQNQKRIVRDRLLYEFRHDVHLTCVDSFGKRVQVDKEHFDYISGTQVFIGKEKTPYEGLVVPIESCKDERGR